MEGNEGSKDECVCVEGNVRGCEMSGVCSWIERERGDGEEKEKRGEVLEMDDGVDL